jgi:hypothetical protein
MQRAVEEDALAARWFQKWESEVVPNTPLDAEREHSSSTAKRPFACSVATARLLKSPVRCKQQRAFKNCGRERVNQDVYDER